MDFTIFIATVVLISLSGVLAPGPLFAVTIAEGRKNPLAGFYISAGHAIVEIPIIMALFVFGTAAGIGYVKAIIALLGGFVLLYFAYNELKPQGQKKFALNGALQKSVRSTIAGIAMSALNPYFLVWWLTVGLNLIFQSVNFGYIGLLAFVVAHEACDFGWLGFVSFTSGKVSRIWGKKAENILKIVSVGILLVFGVYFVYSGVLELLGSG